MIGLVVAAHGHLANELVHTAEQIVGKLSNIESVSIEPGAAPEEIQEKLRAAVRRMDDGNGVIVLADLFGGTPCNQSLMLCTQTQSQLEVITGVNLPMLLKAQSLRADSDMRLTDMAMGLAQYGQKNITCATALLREGANARTN
ncbi:MAG: PTS sugar transporter subunit IIA [Myxococcaceae bacterium]